MKAYPLLVLLFSMQLLHAQQPPAAKPKYVTVINDEIVSQEKVNEYMKAGAVKSMNKGVSEEERARLAAKLGEQVGEREFIIVISLFAEGEKGKEIKPGAATTTKTETKKISGVVIKPGDAAKDFTVVQLDGTEIHLSGLKGKVVLLNFWATWCAPCLMEFYDIPAKILAPYKNESFVFLPVSKGETKEKVAAKMERLKKDGIDFPVAIDPAEITAGLYGADTLPKNVLIDKEGIIRYVTTGNAEGNIEVLANEIRKLLSK